MGTAVIGWSGSAGQAESATGRTIPRSREAVLDEVGVLAVGFVFLVAAGTLTGAAVSAGAAESPSLRDVLPEDEDEEEGIRPGGRTTAGVTGAGGEVGERPLERDLVLDTGSTISGTVVVGVLPSERERSRRGQATGL